MRDMANDTKNKFKEGLDDGTVSAINKNSKPMFFESNINTKVSHDCSTAFYQHKHSTDISNCFYKNICGDTLSSI